MEKAMQRSVLVMGGRGRFGLAAVKAFAAQGWQVLAHVRPGAATEPMNGVHWLPLACDNTAALVQAAADVSVVVHALNPTYTAWETQAMPLLDASLRVAQQAQALLMLPGNVYNFGSDMPELLLEDTAQRAGTRKGRVRIRMEQRLGALAAAGTARSVVLRAGDFFGSGTGSWFDRAVVKDIRRGKMVYPGPLNTATAWAYLPDLATAFVRVAATMLANRSPATPFEVLHFQGHSLTGQQWAGLLGEAAHQHGWVDGDAELAIGSLPWPLIKLGALVVPSWRELIEMQYLWQTPHALGGGKLRALIGPEPRTALPTAVCNSLLALGLVGPTACRAGVWA